MATKAEYEAAKADRKAARDKMIEEQVKGQANETEMMKTAFDFLDRFITAIERIADRMEPK